MLHVLTLSAWHGTGKSLSLLYGTRLSGYHYNSRLFHSRETILRESEKLNPYSVIRALYERQKEKLYVADAFFWKFRCFFRELGGPTLSGRIIEGVLRLWLTADRVEIPFNNVRYGFKSAGGKPANTEKTCRLINFPTRDHNRAHIKHYRLISYAHRRFFSKKFLFCKLVDGSHNIYRASVCILSSS